MSNWLRMNDSQLRITAGEIGRWYFYVNQARFQCVSNKEANRKSRTIILMGKANSPAHKLSE